MRKGTSIWFRRSPESNAPWVALPIGLVVLEVLFVAWLAALLGVLAADEQLSPELLATTGGMVAFVLLGGIAPMFAAYALSTNRRWARSLSFVAVLGILAVIAYYIGIYHSYAPSRVAVWCGAVAAAVGGYLWRSKAVRNYCALVDGKPPPFPAQRSADQTDSVSPALGSNLQLALEYAAVLVGLGIVVAAIRLAME